jgi:membrane protease YdiL (CAAX protease family)
MLLTRKFMRVFKVILHSFILAIVNVASIVFGFGVYHYFIQYNQLAIQVPIAVVFSVIIFTSWIVILKYKNITKLFPQGWLEFLLILIFSFAWLPVIFVPLHYITQGYLTSFGNIYMMWLFQIPANIVIILIAFLIMSQESKKQDSKL